VPPNFITSTGIVSPLIVNCAGFMRLPPQIQDGIKT